MSSDSSLTPAAAEPVASPCVGVCQLNDEELCLGCGRSLAEIAEWSAASEQRRRDILDRARNTLKELRN